MEHTTKNQRIGVTRIKDQAAKNYLAAKAWGSVHRASGPIESHIGRGWLALKEILRLEGGVSH